MSIDFSGYTSNLSTDKIKHTVKGDGVFDNIMEAITEHLKAQYDLGVIDSTDMSTVYLGAIQTAMQTASKIFLEYNISANQALLLEKQKELVEKQILQSQAETELVNARKETEKLKTDLVKAQTLGFKIDAKQKVLSSSMQAWGIYYSSVQEGDPPSSITSTEIDELKDNILNELNE